MSADDDGTGNDRGWGGLLGYLDRRDVFLRRFVLAEVLGPPRAASRARPPVVVPPPEDPTAGDPPAK